jgi:large subunit ribosomal protein L21
MYALVDIKGKQYKAEKGNLLRVDRIESQEGEQLDFDQVLLLSDGENVRVGKPYLPGITVRTKVEGQMRDTKVIVFKYKRRKSYRKTRGHRQHYTLVRVEDISGV